MNAKRMTAGLATASLLLACWVGCQSPQQTVRTKPGELPESLGADGAQPRLSATTYFAHGHLLERQGQYDRAAAQYAAALKLRPEFVTARNRLGITLNKLGKHAEATQAFEAAIARNPGSAYLYNNLGFSLYLENRLTESERALQRALELRPTFSRARMNRGVVLAKLGRFDEAFGEFTLVGSEADAYYNLAMIQADAGHYPQAQRSLEAALARNPAFEPARIKLAEVAERNNLLYPGGNLPVADATAPRIVMAPTETVIQQSPPPTTTIRPLPPTPGPSAGAAPSAARPATATPIAAAPTKPGPAVTITPLTTPSATRAPTPAPQPRTNTVAVSDAGSAPRPPAARPATSPQPKPTAIAAAPTKPATPVSRIGGVADLTSQVRDVTPGRTPTPAAISALTVAPRAAAPTTPIVTPQPAPPPTITDELIEDEEALEKEAQVIPIDMVDRMIDSILRGEFFGAIWCEVEQLFAKPVDVVAGDGKLKSN